MKNAVIAIFIRGISSIFFAWIASKIKLIFEKNDDNILDSSRFY